jgi:putative glutamine amidotransferase
MASSPRIAIPQPTRGDEAYNQRSLPQYVRCVEAAGGVAVPIALSLPRVEQEAVVNGCSGFCLPGSPADVDPGKYGQARQQETAERDELREAVDELIFQEAFGKRKPLLGICFGLQSLNVWRGGTLVQHLPGRMASEVNHAPGRTVRQAHALKVEPGSRLATLWEESGEPMAPGYVNSSHHQAVDLPGKGLHVVAVCPEDGVVEALEGDDAQHFVLGVQWHPERIYDDSPSSRAMFAALLKAAHAWKL